MEIINSQYITDNHYLRWILGYVIKYINPISETYFDFTKSYGLDFFLSLMLSSVIYTFLTISTFYFKRWFTGNYQTQFIQKFSSGKIYKPKLTNMFKYGIVFTWNIFMTIISILLFIVGLDILRLVNTNIAGSGLPLSMDQYIKVSLTNCNIITNINPQIYGKLLFHFVVASKFIEWIDTMVNIIAGNSLIFLHFWHHATIVPLFAMTALYSSITMSGIHINSFIHIVMYLYYSLSVFRKLRPWLNGFKIFITITQIMQFVFCLFIGFIHLHPRYYDQGVVFFKSVITNNQLIVNDNSYSPIFYHVISMSIITSYLVLFLWFFYKTYAKKNNKDKRKTF